MQRRAELEQTAQDQEPAIRDKVERKGPRRVSEGEGKGREGNEGITIRRSEVIERLIQ
jgi:hypothetical protein